MYLGLARVFYEWNDLNTAEQYGEQSFQLAQQYIQVLDRLILSELFLARLKMARGDAAGAERFLLQAEQTSRQKNFTLRLPDIAAAQVMLHLHKGNIEAAAHTAQQNTSALLARVLIAQKDPSAALKILEPLRQQAETKGLLDRLLRVTAVQSLLFMHLVNRIRQWNYLMMC